MIDLLGKKLMILGGNRETGFLVEEANRMGIRTVVVDPNPVAPAKQFAAEHYELDGFDVAGIVDLARRLDVNGVLVGVADVLVGPYMRICQELELPCFASERTVRAFGSKDGFKHACAEFGIQDIPGVVVDRVPALQDIQDIHFPVMVKPVDNGGGVGIRLCAEPNELEQLVTDALGNSNRNRVIIERFMECDDMFAYFTFSDGRAFLSATADRMKTRQLGSGSSVCVAARYPSRHTDDFLEKVLPKLLRMFDGIGVTNGVLCIQFFVQDGLFYAYDPGFRIQGEGPHMHLKAINGFDHRQMLIQFALTGSLGIDNFDVANDVRLRGRIATTFWVLLRNGLIRSIEGLDSIAAHANVTAVLQRLEVGDTIDTDMIGTERQVLARIYVDADSVDVVLKISQELRERLRVIDSEGCDMIYDWVCLEDFD